MSAAISGFGDDHLLSPTPGTDRPRGPFPGPLGGIVVPGLTTLNSQSAPITWEQMTTIRLDLPRFLGDSPLGGDRVGYPSSCSRRSKRGNASSMFRRTHAGSSMKRRPRWRAPAIRLAHQPVAIAA